MQVLAAGRFKVQRVKFVFLKSGFIPVALGGFWSLKVCLQGFGSDRTLSLTTFRGMPVNQLNTEILTIQALKEHQNSK